MIVKTRSELPFSSLALSRFRGEINRMVQQEARELYEGKGYASTNEWADGFEAEKGRSNSNLVKKRS